MRRKGARSEKRTHGDVAWVIDGVDGDKTKLQDILLYARVAHERTRKTAAAAAAHHKHQQQQGASSVGDCAAARKTQPFKMVFSFFTCSPSNCTWTVLLEVSGRWRKFPAPAPALCGDLPLPPLPPPLLPATRSSVSFSEPAVSEPWVLESTLFHSENKVGGAHQRRSKHVR